MGDGERKQVGVGDLAGAVHPIPVDGGCIECAEVTRPEEVPVVGASLDGGVAVGKRPEAVELLGGPPPLPDFAP